MVCAGLLCLRTGALIGARLERKWYNLVRRRGVAQSGLARLHGVQEVGGSNPLAPT